jgi:tetrahydromethanopterin S-methyltransferase subunit D
MLGGALGAFGGMMIYDALTSNNETKHLEAKMNTILANQQLQQKVVQAPQCFLPADAPLVMDPKFYCEQPK